MDLTTVHAPTRKSLHRHSAVRADRWQRPATVLLPAIDRYGAHDHHQPMSTRSIRARLALVSARAESTDPLAESTSSPVQASESPAAAAGTREVVALDDVLTMLDDIADDADALNARIQALLDDSPPRR